MNQRHQSRERGFGLFPACCDGNVLPNSRAEKEKLHDRIRDHRFGTDRIMAGDFYFGVELQGFFHKFVRRTRVQTFPVGQGDTLGQGWSLT